ncbi:MAG: hypothetical protein ACI9R3_000666 [Verrucomicrobiales bacterium]|jgi:hypothetical protein
MKTKITPIFLSAFFALSSASYGGPAPAIDYPDQAVASPQYEVKSRTSTAFTGITSLSYDYIGAGWALSSFDLDDFDDEANGGYIDLSVSIADNAYIRLFGTIQDDTSSGGAAVGLHHELFPTLDLITDVGGFYEDLTEEFGVYSEFGARWLTCKYFELDASVGLDYIDSNADYYGIVRAIVPVYKSLSFVASTRIEDETQTYRAGFRFDF